MPNRILSYSLSPKALHVYAYINSRMNSLHTTILSYEEIALGCHMDRKTAVHAVKELLQRGLIEKETRRSHRGKLKNKYTVGILPGGWFKIEYQVLQTQIRSADFMVYCFIGSCMDRNGEAFPSLNAIAAGTGISHSRVVQAVKYLRRYTFINRVRRHYRRTKAYRHSRYLLFRNKKRKARSHKRSFRKLVNCRSANYSSYFFIIEQKKKKVKLFFAARGSPDFPHLLIIPTRSQIKKEIALYSKYTKRKYMAESI